MRVVVINGTLSHVEQLRTIGSAISENLSVNPGLVPAPIDRGDGYASDDTPLALLFEADGPVGNALRLDSALRLLDVVRTLPEFARFVRLLAIEPATLEDLATTGVFDDFMLAPYTALELRRRVQAAWSRRCGGHSVPEETYRLTPELTVDAGGRHVLLGGASVELTAKEHALLICMCRSFGRVLSRAELIARVWGNDYTGSPRTIDIHVRRLRGKLGAALPLHTVRGAGYWLKVGQRWEPMADEEAAPPASGTTGAGAVSASTAA